MIPVIWHHGAQWLGCTGMLNEILSTPGYEHFCTMRKAPRNESFAVMVIHGDHERNKAAEILDDLRGFHSSLCIIIGESGEFPAHLLQAQRRVIWQQCPVPGKHDFTNRIILGYPPDVPSLLSPYNTLSQDRQYDWFFAGQITHSHRHQCAEQLRKLSRGQLLETPGFWQGMPRPEYFSTMAQAKIIPCPSGPETPDTFRVWEALEAGCVPIVDASCPKAGFPNGFWNYIFGTEVPFPVIEDWNDLPLMIDEQLTIWPANRDKLFMWWLKYKAEMRVQLESARWTW